jgi:hypothetical protein
MVSLSFCFTPVIFLINAAFGGTSANTLMEKLELITIMNSKILMKHEALLHFLSLPIYLAMNKTN